MMFVLAGSEIKKRAYPSDLLLEIFFDTLKDVG